MKRSLVLLLVLLMLTGCGAQEAPAATTAPVQTTEAAVVETTEETTVPTEPEVYFNPVNGTILDEPFTGRLHANTVSNMRENLPHVGVIHADIVMEMFVNMNNIDRCLAIFSDIESVEAIGSTRSTRPIFNDIVQHYDMILTHAGGSSTARNDAEIRGIDNFSIDNWEIASTGASYRDKKYGRNYENTLFGVGKGIKAYAESQGMRMELEKDYGLRFAEDGTPVDGEPADKIHLTFTYGEAKKDTSMIYDAAMDKYAWNQYGKVMKDQITDEVEAFTNVIIMKAGIFTNGGLYHYASFVEGGSGYYANGGKIIPIYWTCESETEPFRFFHEDGTPLELGQGNTYIAICTPESPVTYEEAPPPETVPETVAETVEETAAETTEETVAETAAQ